MPPSRKSWRIFVRRADGKMHAPVDVAALPDECPVLLGYIPLEQLDFVVDPTNQRRIGDAFHKGQNLIDMF
jgi:hypothetical protein